MTNPKLFKIKSEKKIQEGILAATGVHKGLHSPMGEVGELGPYFKSAEILPFSDWMRFQLGAKDESME